MNLETKLKELKVFKRRELALELEILVEVSPTHENIDMSNVYKMATQQMCKDYDLFPRELSTLYKLFKDTPFKTERTLRMYSKK